MIYWCGFDPYHYLTVDNIDYITSESSVGKSSILLNFKLGTDVNKAIADAYSSVAIAKDKLPENTKETFVYLLLTFVIGYIADILIHKLNIFPKLKLYYKVIGSGLWGGLAILFSVSISLLLLYLYNRYNDEQ